jgi:hypothetical protein
VLFLSSISWQHDARRFVLSGTSDIGPKLYFDADVAASAAAVLTDFDGDSDQDRVAGLGQPTLTIWEENLGGNHFAPPRLAEAPHNIYGKSVVADFDGDGSQDQMKLTFSRLFHFSSQDFAKKKKNYEVIAKLKTAVALTCGNLSSDDRLDVVIATADHSLAWYEQLPNLRDARVRFGEPRVLGSLRTNGIGLAATDVTGDGKTDIVAASYIESQLTLWTNQGDGNFAERDLGATLAGPKLIDFADVDADGDLDVIVASQAQIVWHEQGLDDRFQPARPLERIDSAWIRSLPQNIVVYETDELKVAHRLTGYADTTGPAALSPAGDRLAVAMPNHVIRVWELPSERLICTLPTRNAHIWDLAYSPDGRYLLAAIGDYLEVRDAKSHTLLHEQHRHENTIGRIAISADSGRVATISDDLTVRISALTSQGDERILLGHRSRATAVAFSQDGRRLATGAENGTVRVWDVTTGQELLTLSEIGGDNFRIWDLVFRDERTLQAVGVNRERDASFLAEWRAE